MSIQEVSFNLIVRRTIWEWPYLLSGRMDDLVIDSVQNLPVIRLSGMANKPVTDGKRRFPVQSCVKYIWDVKREGLRNISDPANSSLDGCMLISLPRNMAETWCQSHPE